MHRTELADRLGITSKRLITIANTLFEGESKLTFTEDETLQVKGVIEYMRQKNEASVRKAVQQYKEAANSEFAINLDPRSNSSLIPRKHGECGNTQLSQQQLEIAKKRALKQVVAIQEASQLFLADYLENGIPLDEISEVELEALEVAGERVYDAALGKYDAVSNYLPALAQPKMLSAAVN